MNGRRINHSRKSRGPPPTATTSTSFRQGAAEAAGGGTQFLCREDADCSLTGVCAPNGKCECNPWATGADCLYLKLKPVDRLRLGYLDEDHSSWGGSVVVSKSDGRYHMFVSEITCREDSDARKR